MPTHHLKTWPEYYRATLAGKKRFECRKDDRTPRFEVGDELILEEYDPTLFCRTGRSCLVKVTYIFRPPGTTLAVMSHGDPVEVHDRSGSIIPEDQL